MASWTWLAHLIFHSTGSSHLYLTLRLFRFLAIEDMCYADAVPYLIILSKVDPHFHPWIFIRCNFITQTQLAHRDISVFISCIMPPRKAAEHYVIRSDLEDTLMLLILCELLSVLWGFPVFKVIHSGPPQLHHDASRTRTLSVNYIHSNVHRQNHAICLSPLIIKTPRGVTSQTSLSRLSYQYVSIASSYIGISCSCASIQETAISILAWRWIIDFHLSYLLILSCLLNESKVSLRP